MNVSGYDNVPVRGAIKLFEWELSQNSIQCVLHIHTQNLVSRIVLNQTKLVCNCIFPINLATNGIQFGGISWKTTFRYQIPTDPDIQIWSQMMRNVLKRMQTQFFQIFKLFSFSNILFLSFWDLIFRQKVDPISFKLRSA